MSRKGRLRRGHALALLRQSFTTEKKPWLQRSDVPPKWPCSRGKTTSGAWSLLSFPDSLARFCHKSSTSRKHATLPFSMSTSMHDSWRSQEHTSELQSLTNLVCRLLLEKKKKKS